MRAAAFVLHPLKIISLVCWLGLFGFQSSLLWPASGVSYYWGLLLAIPLLIPLPGLLGGKRYTYQWIGFPMLVYFCVGISELATNPQLRVYGLGTTLSSTILFLASIYYARYLGLRERR